LFKGFGLESTIFVGRQSKGSKGTHTLRKTFAKEMKTRLGDIQKVADALGHKSIQSTICYFSFDHEEVDNAILGMEF
jgi:integrase